MAVTNLIPLPRWRYLPAWLVRISMATGLPVSTLCPGEAEAIQWPISGQ